ncbi:gag/pol protein [Cucumis melo var. makuwa]|uniref:Gag/pol protein n=1 Tax=Cucumis melo var. makuwa TaxID=1194695 RepID=A0A5D3BZ53_CUCMM|nr:gag/pol protein [Cucumis melo var. makuwa]
MSEMEELTNSRMVDLEDSSVVDCSQAKDGNVRFSRLDEGEVVRMATMFINMNSSIVQLLAFEKLNGDNYATWKLNLNTILMVDDLRFALTEECPQTPTLIANRTSQEAYDRWIKVDEKVRVYILASMFDVLTKKHESLATAKEIMDSLKGMLGQVEWSIRQEAIKYIYTERMKKGTSVKEHVLDMMMHFNIAEVNGGAIDEANQVSFILESLPKSFIPFQTNASLNKIEFNLTILLNEL